MFWTLVFSLIIFNCRISAKQPPYILCLATILIKIDLVAHQKSENFRFGPFQETFALPCARSCKILYGRA